MLPARFLLTFTNQTVFAMSTIDGPPRSTEASDAYESGWTAYKQDLDRTDNPYDAQQDPVAFKGWMRGWTDALEEMEEVER
jgi:hypothetical protein